MLLFTGISEVWVPFHVRKFAPLCESDAVWVTSLKNVCLMGVRMFFLVVSCQMILEMGLLYKPLLCFQNQQELPASRSL